jgi:hypothetical protein
MLVEQSDTSGGDGILADRHCVRVPFCIFGASKGLPTEEPRMENVVRELRRDFTVAISSEQNDMTLDSSIASLRSKISAQPFLGVFSLYSRSHLRKMHEVLRHISVAHLKQNPLQVALAVDSILNLFDALETTVRQSAASDKRIEAGRSP